MQCTACGAPVSGYDKEKYNFKCRACFMKSVNKFVHPLGDM